MKTILVMSSIVVALAVVEQLHGEDAKNRLAAPSSLNEQHVVFFGPSHPVFMRLSIQWDGKPCGQVWFEQVSELFKALDSNRDGFLTEDEADARRHAKSSEAGAILRLGGLWAADSAPFDGRLTIGELADFLVVRKLGPLQSPPNRMSIATSTRPATKSTASAASQTLFDLLDANQDASLSPKEVANASSVFGKYDLDDNGAVALGELRAIGSPFAGGGATTAAGSGPVPLFTVSADRSLSAVIDRLYERYAQSALSASQQRGFPLLQLGLPQQTFSQFDADSDGQMDYDETRVFLKNPVPTLELRVSLVSGFAKAAISEQHGMQPAIDVVVLDAEADIKIRRTSAGLVSIVLGNVQIEVGGDGVTGETTKRFLLSRFMALDRDKNDYLDAEEIRRSRDFADAIDEFDLDQDGRLFQREMISVVSRRIQAARSRTRLTMTNRGHDLFQILDANRDGQLGPRELQEAARRLPLWDSDGNGIVALSEVPQLFQMSFGPGLPSFSGVPLLQAAAGARRRSRNNAATTGPVWFQRMDRNRDGDVSWREFLGDRSKFQELDRNDDGLIGLIEALQVR